jgi:hypothetical protein
MSLRPKLQARTYGVLVHARKARGGRLEAELQRRVQAHQAQVEAAHEAADAQAQALEAFAACVDKLRTRLSSRVALHVDEVLRLRAQRDAMEARHQAAVGAREEADQQVLRRAEDCAAQRRLIAANDEQVKSLQELQDKALAAHAQGVEDAEEDEREEAYAGRMMMAAP